MHLNQIKEMYVLHRTFFDVRICDAISAYISMTLMSYLNENFCLAAKIERYIPTFPPAKPTGAPGRMRWGIQQRIGGFSCAPDSPDAAPNQVRFGAAARCAGHRRESLAL